MFFRPGNQVQSRQISRDYDEVWTETLVADMDFNNRRSLRDEISDVTYVYWNRGEFVVALNYAAGKSSSVPGSVRRGSVRSRERFLYRRVGNEWFVLDTVFDRKWFDVAAKGYR